MFRFGWNRGPVFNLGGGGGGGQPVQTSSTTTTVRELSPEQRELLQTVIPTAKSFAENPPTLFPGSGIADVNPLQTQAQNMALDTAQNFLPQQIGSANAAQDFMLGPVLFPESNPALARATEAAIRPITQNFEQNILPNIRGEAVAAGQLGSSRQGVAEGIASQGYLQQIGDTSATLQSENYQAGLDAMTRALLNAPQMFNTNFLPAQMTEAIGTQRRAEEQAQLSEQVQRYIAEQVLPFTAAQDVAALAFGIPAGTSTSTAIGNNMAMTGSSSPIMSALGGAGMGAAFGPWGAGAGAALGLLSSFL